MSLWPVVLIGSLLFLQSNAAKKSCDLFQGSWVRDSSLYPLYNSSSCPFIQREFNCQKNGRPDSLYLRYNWQPHACNLSRYVFDEGDVYIIFLL